MRPEIKKEEDKAVQVEHEEKLHWYCFVFLDKYPFSIYSGSTEKDKVIKSNIERLKKDAMKDFNILTDPNYIVLVNMIYLGFMTKKEFEKS
jgi:hypothetical protein